EGVQRDLDLGARRQGEEALAAAADLRVVVLDAFLQGRDRALAQLFQPLVGVLADLERVVGELLDEGGGLGGVGRPLPLRLLGGDTAGGQEEAHQQQARNNQTSHDRILPDANRLKSGGSEPRVGPAVSGAVRDNISRRYSKILATRRRDASR